ncbi:MAG: tetratricopeptide repeat protein, partial [Candidatus Omnitrophota bacterium]
MNTEKLLAASRLILMLVFSCNACFAASAEKMDRETHNNLRHYMNQARIHYDHARYREAIDWWQKAKPLDPQNQKIDRYIKRATKKLNIPETKAEKKTGALVNRGRSYYSKGRYQWALDEWQAAARLDPGDVKIQRYIERAQNKLKQKPEDRVVEPDMQIAKRKSLSEIYEPAFEYPGDGPFTVDSAINIGVANHIPIQVAAEQ